MTFSPDKTLVRTLLVTVCRLLTGIKARWRATPQVEQPTIAVRRFVYSADGCQPDWVHTFAPQAKRHHCQPQRQNPRLVGDVYYFDDRHADRSDRLRGVICADVILRTARMRDVDAHAPGRS